MIDTPGTQDVVETALERLRRASPSWRDLGVARRLAFVEHCARLIARSEAELTQALVADGGSRLVERQSGIASMTPSRLAAYARSMTVVVVDGRGEPLGEILHHRPDGVVVLSSPARAPSVGLIPLLEVLLVGNCVLVRCSRPSAVASFMISVIERAKKTFDMPLDIVELVVAPARQTLAVAVPSPHSDTIVFYGGTTAGRSLAELARSHDKKLFLELEAVDSILIWRDGDLEGAVQSALGGFDYSGMPCISPRRIFCHPAVYDHVKGALSTLAPSRAVPVREGSGYAVPIDRAARQRLLERYATYTTLVHGGTGFEADGADYLEPTIVTCDLSSLSGDWPTWFDVEQLGPVLTLIRCDGPSPIEGVCKILERSAFQNRVSVWTEDDDVRCKVLGATSRTGSVSFGVAHTSNPVFGGFSGGKRSTGGPDGETALFWRKTSMLQTLRCPGSHERVLAALGATQLHHTIEMSP